MIAAVFLAHAAVAVAVEAGHGFLGEEGEGLFEDCWRNKNREKRWLALTWFFDVSVRGGRYHTIEIVVARLSGHVVEGGYQS